MWVCAAEHVAGETNKELRYATMETLGDVLGACFLRGGGRTSPCPHEESRRWALSDVMSPGWLVLCLIYV